MKTDDKIINQHYIRWVKKFGECMEVCTKSDGCRAGQDTHRVSKLYSPESYDKLKRLFES
jgi:hypothetical protein